MHCLHYGHKEKHNYFDEKRCLSVLLNHFKRLFRLLKFLTLRFDAFKGKIRQIKQGGE